MQNLTLEQPKPNQRQMLGRFSINPLMYVYIPILFCTPLYTYHMAVAHKQEKPFPWATVTSTACHYPQDIVFRYTMLIASSIISLTFFIVFRWLQNECTRVGYKRLNRWYLYVTEFSMLCYSITIGTIDEKGIGKLHGPCAVTFFVIWMIIIIRITFFISALRQWDSTVVSRKSMLLKKLLAFYVSGVWVYCIYGLILYSDQQLQRKSDMYVVIVEWNSVLVNLLWVMSFVLEWKELNFCLDFYPVNQQNLQTHQQQFINIHEEQNMTIYQQHMNTQEHQPMNIPSRNYARPFTNRFCNFEKMQSNQNQFTNQC